jgi:hypothetical protein
MPILPFLGRKAIIKIAGAAVRLGIGAAAIFALTFHLVNSTKSKKKK